MYRRAVLAGLGTAGTAALAGCGVARGQTTLSDPTVEADGPGRKVLLFSTDGEELAHFGVDGRVRDGAVKLQSELWHRDGTLVDAVRLQMWMPDAETDSTTDVGLVSPVEGDSSPPPEVTLSTPERGRGTVIEIGDLDDLRDETISTIALLVSSIAEGATEIAIDVEIELTSGGVVGDSYTLEGRLDLSYPALGN
jgi:hypothetical protein